MLLNNSVTILTASELFTEITHTQRKRICKDFEIIKIGEYQDLYVQSNKLNLADVFESCRNI